ncbi:MAG TPA: hypothetical protein EYP19_03175 [Desulfobacterales bacterium]|nr:hypothetical protein [Desulfobacterales bacterium]
MCKDNQPIALGRGVAKSSIAANIAVALSNKDLKTGLMDLDLRGCAEDH